MQILLSKAFSQGMDCSSFVSDGASMMVVKKNQVAAKKKSVVPSIYVDCSP
jgi:hypothetical protein